MARTLTQRDLSRFYRLTDMKPGPVGRADGQTQGFRVTTNVPVFPLGTVTHPEYGELDFSEATLREYVRHWEDNTRRIELAVDIDHKNEEAVGWVKRVYFVADEGVYGDVEWNRHGQALLNDRAYKFISPQFGDHVNEVTGETTKNVLIALTITNFPFLKEMPSISLDERQHRPAKLIDRARRALLTEGYTARDRRLFDRMLHSRKTNLPEQRVPCKQGCMRCVRMSKGRRSA